MTAIIGETVQFECEVTFGEHDGDVLAWFFEDKKVYQQFALSEDYPEGRTKYSVTKNGNHFTLNVKNITMEDGGEYNCSTLTSKATAYLLVLGKDTSNDLNQLNII